MSNSYTLYGSYASYYTAKTRAYLRKKGIPFVERLPSDPMFRNKVRPASGSHRIPQLLTPDGTVVQDSVVIQDFLEAQHPDLPVIPAAPRQRVVVHLMELLASEGLLRLAWLHRWVFAENLDFVIKEFGRSFQPQGSDDELVKYGSLIADRMRSYGLPESTPELRAELDAQYLALLSLFETHLIEHPYFLGGHPSAADYALMGALHAHMGRDPAGLHLMQRHAPRVFRWIEHMLVPEVQSPEFFSRAIRYPDDDEVPTTALALMHHIAEHYGASFVMSAMAFNDAMAELAPPAGYELDVESDQPTLAVREVEYRGELNTHNAQLHHVWLSQRARVFYQVLEVAEQAAIRALLGEESVALELLNVPVERRIERVHNRLVVA